MVNMHTNTCPLVRDAFLTNIGLTTSRPVFRVRNANSTFAKSLYLSCTVHGSATSRERSVLTT